MRDCVCVFFWEVEPPGYLHIHDLQVTKKANGQLADSLLMGYMLSVIARQGKIYSQDDHADRYLDGELR